MTTNNNKIYNFAPGPAMLPDSVKKQIIADIPNWRGTGSSIMEVSHRGAEFRNMVKETELLIREILNISDEYYILMTPGGARLQYSMMPMNFSSLTGKTMYFVHGHWGKSAIVEAQKFCNARPLVAYKADEIYTAVPKYDMSQLDNSFDYFHYTTNETLEGVEWHDIPPNNDIPMFCDMTSNLMTKPIDVSRYSLIYASAQKNLGIAGITLVIIKKSMLDQTPSNSLPRNLPLMLDYRTYSKHDSLWNTPPTFSWYVLNLMLNWIKNTGGLTAIEIRNNEKASKLYNYIDSSSFYHNNVKIENRSKVNVTFLLADETLNTSFLQQADAIGLKAIKGHRAVGGMRASIYNAMPIAGVNTLIEFMQNFENNNG
ncbi:Phosphoserine aminotransferase [hydrothermal vent metagenome]|uniref:phosphoserine transaminase n=1 Tax=hydrothermal vent metagenome TaxID=652676 RepID=A0A3B0V5F9_9ZZZZ